MGDVASIQGSDVVPFVTKAQLEERLQQLWDAGAAAKRTALENPTPENENHANEALEAYFAASLKPHKRQPNG